MERLGKFVALAFVKLGKIGYDILTLIWLVAATIICLLAALLALPMALIKKNDGCLMAIMGVWMILGSLPAKILMLGEIRAKDVSSKLAEWEQAHGGEGVYSADENIERGKELIKAYWYGES